MTTKTLNSIAQIRAWAKEEQDKGNNVRFMAEMAIRECLRVPEEIKWRAGNVHLNNIYRGVKD